MADDIIEVPDVKVAIPNVDPPPQTTNKPEFQGEDDPFVQLERQMERETAESMRKAEQSKPKEEPAKEVKPAEPVEEPADTKPKLDLTPKKAGAESDADAVAKARQSLKDGGPVPRSSEYWKRWKHDADLVTTDLDRKLQKALTELDLIKTQGTPDMAALRDERDKLAQQLKEYSVLGDPSLTLEFDQKIQAAVESSKSGLDAKKAALFETLARMPASDAKDNLAAEFYEDMSTAKQIAFGAKLNRLEELMGERDAKIKDARANADAYLQRRTEQANAAKQARVETLNRAFTQVITERRQEEGWSDLLGNEEIAKALEADAKRLYSGSEQDPRVAARRALDAAVTPLLLPYAVGQAKELAELKDLVEQMKSARPKLDATGAPQPSAIPEDREVFALQDLQRVLGQD